MTTIMSTMMSTMMTTRSLTTKQRTHAPGTHGRSSCRLVLAQAGRTATVLRQTKETKIDLTINIDGTGK